MKRTLFFAIACLALLGAVPAKAATTTYTMIQIHITICGSTVCGSAPVYTPGFDTLANCQAAGSTINGGLPLSIPPNAGTILNKGVCFAYVTP